MANAVLHLIDPASPMDETRACLTGEETARAERFVFPADAVRWTCYRAGLRKILGKTLSLDPADVPLIEGPGGKPALAPPHDHLEFNLSHADDLAAVIVSSHGPVGIDIEPWSRASSLIECADFFCHPDELNELPTDDEARAVRLLEIWTSKEALLKAVGTGLSFPPPQLCVDGDRGRSDSILEGLSMFHLLIPDHPAIPNHRIAIAVTSTIDGFIWDDDSLATRHQPSPQ